MVVPVATKSATVAVSQNSCGVTDAGAGVSLIIILTVIFTSSQVPIASTS